VSRHFASSDRSRDSAHDKRYLDVQSMSRLATIECFRDLGGNERARSDASSICSTTRTPLPQRCLLRRRRYRFSSSATVGNRLRLHASVQVRAPSVMRSDHAVSDIGRNGLFDRGQASAVDLLHLYLRITRCVPETGWRFLHARFYPHSLAYLPNNHVTRVEQDVGLP